VSTNRLREEVVAGSIQSRSSERIHMISMKTVRTPICVTPSINSGLGSLATTHSPSKVANASVCVLIPNDLIFYNNVDVRTLSQNT